MTKITRLNSLDIQSNGIVIKIDDNGQLRQKFLSMGVIPNSNFAIIKKAPFSGPIDIKIKGYHLLIRSEEAHKIIVKKV